MKEYNAAFFSLYENTFIVLKQNFGEEKALAVFGEIIKLGLRKAYDAAGFEKGDKEDFVRVVGERDAAVGLHVEFPKITGDRITYRFYTDPFPNLRGQIGYKKLSDTYMLFKITYLLGSEWSYKITKHIWNGDKYIEYVITKGD